MDTITSIVVEYSALLIFSITLFIWLCYSYGGMVMLICHTLCCAKIHDDEIDESPLVVFTRHRNKSVTEDSNGKQPYEVIEEELYKIGVLPAVKQNEIRM